MRAAGLRPKETLEIPNRMWQPGSSSWEALSHAIEQSCLNKAAVVSQDEMESGLRAILNLGHTFGHAIETAQNYTEWLHGEAVAAGIAMAADLSRRSGFITEADSKRIIRLLERANLPLQRPDSLDPVQLRELMNLDKKVRDGKVKLVLLQEIGKAIVTTDYNEQDVLATLNGDTT